MVVFYMEAKTLLEKYNNLIEHVNNLKLKYDVNQNVSVIAVTKYSDIDTVKNFAGLGLNVSLAESKAQSLRDRASTIKNVSWHFLGRIQTNKLKYIIPNTSLIHSVDSIEIIEDINKESIKNNKIQNILIQFNISEEEQKGGIELKEANHIFDKASQYQNINIIGLMGMAEYTNDESIIEREFGLLKTKFESLKTEYKNFDLKELSMGMSGDYHLGIKHGATMIRIGSLLFN